MINPETEGVYLPQEQGREISQWIAFGKGGGLQYRGIFAAIFMRSVAGTHGIFTSRKNAKVRKGKHHQLWIDRTPHVATMATSEELMAAIRLSGRIKIFE
jgi:hypothetical protein